MSLLVVLGYVWPEPDSSAAGRRMLSLIRMYRERDWQVIFASPAERGPHRFALSQWQIEEVVITLNDSSFDQWIAALQPDVVLFDRFMLEEQFGWRVEAACPQALRLLDSEDLHCLRAARQQAFHAGRAMTQADLTSELALREIAAILRVDLTLTISLAEMRLLQQHYQIAASQLLYCPFLLDDPLYGSWQPFAARQHFVTIGNFRHEPNWQSVLWLKREIWPLIRAQLPQAELHIYGAYPPPKATALHAPKQGFMLKGWASDAHQVLQQARVCLAPLQFGAGLKGKFIDAMQTGTPSVTTAIGAEGMGLTEQDVVQSAQWCGLVAESATALADAAVELYQNETLWLQKQQLGGQILTEKFARSQLEPLLWQRLEQVRCELPAHRSQHFYGAMLRYHLFRSNKFMGQWIEAKTKLAQIQQSQGMV